MGKFHRTSLKGTQDSIQLRPAFLWDQADPLFEKINMYTWNAHRHTHTHSTLHYPDTRTNTCSCHRTARPRDVCSVRLQAVQGDPILSGLPLLGRWKCCEAEGLNRAAIYSRSEEARDAGSGWGAEGLAASQVTDTLQEQDTQAKVCQCCKPTCL